MVTDAISDYFFVTEESGSANLLREGKPAEQVHFAGHVMIDNLLYQVGKMMAGGNDSWIPACAGMSAPGSRRDLGGESPPPRLCPISVAEGNCVAVRRGGEQPEVNTQSVG